jgi:cytochrome c biogenesis protein CcdA/glutaredoxin
MRKLHVIFVFLAFLFIGFIAAFFLKQNVYAQTEIRSDKISVIVFVRNGCAHCQNEEKYLDELVLTRDDIAVTKYRLENENERKIWVDFTDRLKISKVTPITIIGNTYIIGFDTKETTGVEILKLIEKAKQSDIVTDIDSPDIQSVESMSATCPDDGSVPCAIPDESFVTVPLIGRIDTHKYPLIILSAMLGFFDGFNPCAMWVLVTFLIILLQVGSRKKMLLFAGTFVIAEAVMYFLILTVWYKTWDFVKLDSLVTPIVGIIAIGGGIFFLREWWKKELECKVTNLSQRKKIHDKVKELAMSKFTFLTFFGILAVAFSVNIIEFACSIGIPQAFTKILELNQVTFMQSLGFIALYILFYMIDDFIVFGIALYGADKLSITTKYSKLSNLIGGIIMILLGIILIFFPSFLFF